MLGDLLGLARTTPLTAQTQAFFKLALGVFIIFYGLRLMWWSVGGDFQHVFKQIVIAFLAVMVGKLAGQLLHFQKASNRLGQYARELIERTKPDDPQRFTNGLNACAILFCASPLGILGAVQDGLPGQPDGAGYYYPLAVKGVMDGLAMMSFVTLFGWGGMPLPTSLVTGSVVGSHCPEILAPPLVLVLEFPP